MCGIVGYITLKDETIEHSKDKYLTEAIFADTLRGHDSTGIMTISDEFQWSYQKQAISGCDFVTEKSYWERDMKTWCAVGHNRSATVGSVSTDNAHPFKHGKVLLVHNGTLRSTYDLPHKKKKIEVDSELIAYNLSKEPPEKAHEILSKLCGAYALVWFDERDQSVNFARNSERPFHIAINKDENCLFFSSDGHLLNFVGRRMTNLNSRPNRIYQMGTGQHLKYKKGSLVPEVTKVLPFTHVTTVRTYPSGRQSGTSQQGARERIMPAARAAAFGKVMIAGKCRDIPAVHIDMMQWYMLEPTQEFAFEPKEYLPWGNQPRGYVYGRIWHDEWEAWINARVEGTFLSIGNYPGMWTVQPVGCDHTSLKGGGKDELTVMCTLKTYSYRGKAFDVDAVTVGGYDQGSAVMDGDVDVDLVTGPHGDITVESFQCLVIDGCAMCADPVFIEDHDQIIWVGEMQNQPMCKGCVDDSIKQGGYVHDVYSKD